MDGGEREPRRVYTPGDVAERMGISGQRLRQLARSYERVHGDLPRDERGRVWPEEDIEELERARELVRYGRAGGIEQALRGDLMPEGSGDRPATREPGADDIAAVAHLAGELGALREAVEEQNRIMLSMVERLEALERENRELRAALPAPAEPVMEDRESKETEPVPEPERGARELGLFGRVRAWIRGW